MAKIDPKYRGKLVDTFYFRGEKIEVYENNDPNLDPDTILSLLARGRRTPQNEHEEKLLMEIKEIYDRGDELDIPFN